jgi:hypothetical protein
MHTLFDIEVENIDIDNINNQQFIDNDIQSMFSTFCMVMEI